ncbi:MAG: radical SAM protein [Planctomycetes bacterium]|nr:radical SAM protein [Planctomycetota bacterium]
MSTVTEAPTIGLSSLDHLWFQVAGTRCNLTCTHCFISCSPKNDLFGFLSLEQVKRSLEESVAHGVKEYYFTGGEPFLNPDMVPILVESLRYGTTTVLTNATVFKDAWLEALAEADRCSQYKLEFRVSIDGFSPETNDPIRGEGTFDRAIKGIVKLLEFGFAPIITATRTWPCDQESQVVGNFEKMLVSLGYESPRLKILPSLKLGAEVERTSGYCDSQRITERMMTSFDKTQLLCDHSRIVTDKGVYVCPILIDSPEAKMGETLAETFGEFPLKFGACYTCYQYGAICSNPSTDAPKSCGTSCSDA